MTPMPTLVCNPNDPCTYLARVGSLHLDNDSCADMENWVVIHDGEFERFLDGGFPGNIFVALVRGTFSCCPLDSCMQPRRTFQDTNSGSRDCVAAWFLSDSHALLPHLFFGFGRDCIAATATAKLVVFFWVLAATASRPLPLLSL